MSARERILGRLRAAKGASQQLASPELGPRPAHAAPARYVRR